MPNRLAAEPSLYLRQHADQPVDWYPWGEEAFARARELDRPVLVSIGYSACHWCHVMAHECFDDPGLAALLNRNFIAIKVDREERPDVDQVYMEAVQMMNGHGGWPLNVFCLPDGRPFAGGTYFPPVDNGRGIIPWPQLLARVADFFRRQRADLEENAGAIVANLAAFNRPPGADGESGPARFDPALLVAAGEAVAGQHDDARGGFGGAPKFPPHGALDLLLELRRTAAVDERHPALARRVDAILPRTLDAMARGGLRDHVGGGFHRYCVDGTWTIPHFEKMLPDNGQLLAAFARAHRRHPSPLWREAIEDTVDFLLRELHVPGQGFAAAIDADSTEGEGIFHTWTPAEVHAVLGAEDGARWCAAYGITEAGNFEHGRSQPVLVDGPAASALAPLTLRLREARSRRPAPVVDPKRLPAWNALAITGLVEAGLALGRLEWIGLARDTAAFLWDHVRVGPDRLAGVWYPGGVGARGLGTLDDHAFLADALARLGGAIDLVEPGASATWLARASALAGACLRDFADPSGEPGCFFTASDAPALCARRKEWFDNALPSGNGQLAGALALLRVAAPDPRWEPALGSLRQAFAGPATRVAHGVPSALAAIVSDLAGVAVVKARDAATLAVAAAALASRPARRSALLVDPAAPEGFSLCVGDQCLPPMADPAELAAAF